MSIQSGNIVKLPKVYYVISICCVIIFLCILTGYLMTSDEIDILITAIFSAFVFMCLFEVMISLNWKVKYDDECFEYRTMFRHTLKLKYTHITSVRTTKSGATWLKVGRRLLLIDPFAVGREEFLDKVIGVLDMVFWERKRRKAVLTKRQRKQRKL